VSTSTHIHLIVGEDDFLVETTARKLILAALAQTPYDQAVETVPGNAGNSEEQMRALRACEASVQTPPFLEPVKVTWWRNVTFLPGGGQGGRIAESVKEALERFARLLSQAPLPPNQHLVVTAPKLLPTSIFAKTLKDIADLRLFPSETRADRRQQAALARVNDLAKDESLVFAPGADQAFVAKAGTDTRTLVSELAKLRAYLGTESDTVSAKHIAEITSAGGSEPELWDITDAVGARDPVRLVRVFSKFADIQKMGVLLATVAEKFFRELIVYREACDNGWLSEGGWSSRIPEDIRRHLDDAGVGPGAAKSDWAARRGARHARAFTLRELRLARFRLLAAREKVVSSEADGELVKMELLRLVARSARAGGKPSSSSPPKR
jgi:DNA polymerase III delta subunit